MTQTLLPNEGLPQGYLSPSQVSKFLTCGAKYKFQYVDRIPDPFGVDAIVGIAAHAGLEAAFKAWDEHGGHAGMPLLVTMASDRARAAFIEKIVEASEGAGIRDHENSTNNLDELAQAAADLARFALPEVAARIQRPLRVEAGVLLEGQDYSMKGFIDLIAESLWETGASRKWLIDYKFTKRSPPQGYASREHSLQLLTYANMLPPGDVDEVWVAYVVRNKTPKVEWRQVPLTVGSKAWARSVVESAHRGIVGKQFAPNPIAAGFLCSPTMCGYWSRCIGAPKHEEQP